MMTRENILQEAFWQIGVTDLPPVAHSHYKLAVKQVEKALAACLEYGAWYFARVRSALYGAGEFSLPNDCALLLACDSDDYRLEGDVVMAHGRTQLQVEYVSRSFYQDNPSMTDQLAMPVYFADAVMAKTASLIAQPVLCDFKLAMNFRELAAQALSDGLFADVSQAGGHQQAIDPLRRAQGDIHPYHDTYGF